MSGRGWSERFLATTRGQILLLLRRSERTVNELAEALGLTDNAVRAHLAALERDGLVEQRGVRRGVGKPAYVYRLSPEADQLFPKAYGLVLGGLLEVLTERLGREAVEEALREVGRRAGAGRGAPAGEDLRARFEAAVAVLGEFGGDAAVEATEGGGVRIRGYACPFSAVVAEHPEVCALAEALVSELVGVPVRECCDRGERPRCVFELA
ncbi:MAG TPA: ArsR family transcriptional regulator [Longimicrobiales bacterium]